MEEEIERKLPTLDIAGIPFIVDVDYNVLRHPEQDSIGYRFFEDMENTGLYYRLYVNKQTLEAVLPAQARNNTDVLICEVPHMVKLDPTGVAQKYLCRLEDLPDYDQMLENNSDLLAGRRRGKPAAIFILDTRFFVDTKNGYLVTQGTGARDWLNVNGMAQDPLCTVYRCLYNPESKKEFKAAPGAEIPEGIIALEIPHLRFSDSYNYRNVHGARLDLSDQEWLLRYPVRSNMKARVIAAEKMGYRRMLDENIKRQQAPGISKGRASPQQDPLADRGRQKGHGNRP